MKHIKLKIKNTLLKNIFSKSSSIIFIIIFTLILISNQKMYSQSVDSLIIEALENNPKLKSLESNIKVSEYRSKSVNNLPPPNLSTSRNFSFSSINRKPPSSIIFDIAIFFKLLFSPFMSLSMSSHFLRL